MSMLDPDNLAPIQDNSNANDSAPHYNAHRFDRRYQPSPEALAAEAPPLEEHPPLSTITNADLATSRKAPPPHFSSHLNPNDASPSYIQNTNENQQPPPRLAVHSAAPSHAYPRSANSGMPAAPVDNNPAYLTLDKDLIFPPPPSQALYSLKFAISSTGTSNMLFASIPSTTRPDGTVRQSAVQDKDLYSLSFVKLFGTFEIKGQRKSTIPRTLWMKRFYNWRGKIWWQCKVEMDGKILIQTKNDQWLDGEGNVIGREEGGVQPSTSQLKAIRKANQDRKLGEDVPWKAPVLELMGVARDGSDGGRIRSLLVACWVCKCWFVEVQTGEQLPEKRRTNHEYVKSLGSAVIGSE